MSGELGVTPSGATTLVLDQQVGAAVIDAQNNSVHIGGSIRLDNFNMYATNTVWFQIGLVDKKIYDWYSGSQNEFGAPRPDMIWSQSVFMSTSWNDESKRYEMHLQDYFGQNDSPIQVDGNRFDYEINFTPTGSQNGTAEMRIKPYRGNWLSWTVPWTYELDEQNGWRDVNLSQSYLVAQLGAQAGYQNSDVAATFTASPIIVPGIVPEPISFATCLMALSGLGMYLRRRVR